MTAKPVSRVSDAAMLAWLAGDDTVTAAASRIWDVTGQLTAATAELRAAQIELRAATDAYTQAIHACRIPTEHAERLGAALILRIGRTRILTELDQPGPAGDASMP